VWRRGNHHAEESKPFFFFKSMWVDVFLSFLKVYDRVGLVTASEHTYFYMLAKIIERRFIL
jgi:hypothetical protein